MNKGLKGEGVAISSQIWNKVSLVYAMMTWM